jgi:2-haloalkanoic acid dehalogenase type II
VRLTQFKLLSFGCYGTLIDRESGIYSALRPLLAHGDVTLSRAAILARFAEIEARQQAEAPTMAYSRVLFEVHRQLAREWGINASDDDHTLFGRSVPQWPAYVDVPAALQYLKRFFKLAILSNVDRPNLAGSNRRLEVMFDVIFTAQEIGSCKPDPRNFEHMVNRLAKLDVERHQILHAAQNLTRDREPAVTCGLAFAWIDRASNAAHPPAQSPPAVGAGQDLRFANLVDMVRAHQEQLRS